MYSRETYGRVLRTIVETGYRVVTFADLDPESDERQVVLRHDVDFIPRLALEMAEIDSSCGVNATFFFLVRSHAYNLFSPANVALLHDIERRGHTIGLHTALPAGVPEREGDLAKLVQDDLALGRLAFPRMASLFAWHTVPPPFFERWRDLSVPGVVNVYDQPYFSRIGFISDSNARCSADELQDIFRRGVHRKVQLLLHPIIWMCGGATMMEVFSNAWKYFVRELELELKVNGTYRQRLPEGVPEDAIRAFAGALLGGDERVKTV